MEGQFLCSIWTPPWSRKKPHEKGNATQAQTDKYKKGARTLYCIYSFSRTFRNTLSVPSTRNLARVQIAAPLCRVFANMMILCAQSPRRPEIQANRLKTREAVCCTHLHPLEPRLTYDSQDSSQGTRLEWVTRNGCPQRDSRWYVCADADPRLWIIGGSIISKDTSTSLTTEEPSLQINWCACKGSWQMHDRSLVPWTT